MTLDIFNFSSKSISSRESYVMTGVSFVTKPLVHKLAKHCIFLSGSFHRHSKVHDPFRTSLHSALRVVLIRTGGWLSINQHGITILSFLFHS